MKISVILPTFNENGNIANLLQKIDENIKGYEKEILVVDDNSPDGTATTAFSLKPKYKNLKVIVRKRNHGLALSIKDGIRKSNGDIIIIMDSDLSHPPRFIPMLIQEIKNHDVVIASRFIKGGKMVYGNSRLPVYASKSINFFVRSFLCLSIKDVTGGFFAIRRNILERVNVDEIFRFYGDYFFHLLFHLTKEKIKIVEVPFSYEPRLTGKSKTRLIRTGFLYIREVFKILLNH